MNRAVFLDRDGTINEDVGDFCTPDKLIFIPQALNALKILQTRFMLFIITNQSGIGKNIFTEEDFLKFDEYFKNYLESLGIYIKHTYYCPHTKEINCICRKPSPYFIKEAEKQYSIDIKKSYVIGDHPHDIEMAERVSAGSVYLLTGHGRKHRDELTTKPDFIAKNLYEGACWIMKNIK
ncbi:MAG: HAD family hydrolase [Candidatus Omnitrophica bacterium]|nr:HAD family hydrolase [Candidatus Omnitrophota bacterium]